MEKKYNRIIILLSVFIVASIGFSIYQYQNINQLTEQVNILTQEKNQLTEQVSTLTEDREKLTNQVSELNSKIENLDSKIKAYLEAEGRKCDKETEICLDELTKRLKTVVGPDCSSIPDGICPKWCAAGADYDCCIEKGYEWIQGRGCYSK